jgi:transposase
MTRRSYELTDREWSIISPLLPNNPRGYLASMIAGFEWHSCGGFGRDRHGRRFPNATARRRPATIACAGERQGSGIGFS